MPKQADDVAGASPGDVLHLSAWTRTRRPILTFLPVRVWITVSPLASVPW